VDLFVANSDGNNFLFHNNGNGSFTRTNSPASTDAGSFQTVNWIEYDNDGWLDLFVTSVQSGTSCRLYHNNGDGTFSRVLGSPLLTDAGLPDFSHFSRVLGSNDGMIPAQGRTSAQRRLKPSR
jgi:hypothetical protein